MPNSIGANGILRVVPHTVSVPRMFYNVYAPSNTFIMWRRKTKLEDLGLNYWFLTGQAQWTPTLITIPPGIYTMQSLADQINADPVNAGWIYLNYNNSPPRVDFFGPYYSWTQWGNIDQPENPPLPPEYMPQTFLTEPPGSHLFDILGLGGASFVSSPTNWLSYAFDDRVPATADSIRGTDIEKAPFVIPVFRTDSHDMGSYALAQYLIPGVNPMNLTGPVWVNVVIEELGDNSTIDTETGKPISVVACVPVSEVDNGRYSTRVVRDCDAEAIQFATERSIRSFRVRCEDINGTTLTLPRNWPILLRLQILQTQ